VQALVGRLEAAGAVLKLPPQGMDRVLEEGLAPLIARGLVTPQLQPVAAEKALLAFYAASVPAV
jgi:glycerol-3-phosphate O-acyltransferase